MNEIINLIGKVALSSVPTQNWELIVLKSKNLLTYAESPSLYFENGIQKSFLGSTKFSDGRTLYIQDLQIQLREETYKQNPGKGAWYSMEMKISKDGQFDIRFDYDTKPEFSIPLEDSDFIKDYQRFPRDTESTPEWLNEILKSNNIIS